jgi:hypothetical protein
MNSDSGAKRLIDRSRAAAQQADQVILAALDRAGPAGSTVPSLVGACDLGERRVQRRLTSLVADGRVRREQRTYFLVVAGAELVLADQETADRRASFMRNAERAAYLGKLADLLIALDRRAVPAGLHEPAAAAQSILRDISRAIQDSDYEKFVLIRADWSHDIEIVIGLIGRIEQLRRDQRETAIAQNRWRDAHDKKIQLLTQEVTAQRRRLTRKRDSFLDLADNVPMSGGYKYRVPITRAEIAEYERIGLIETDWIAAVGLFRFQSRYDSRIGFERRRERFWEHETETCRVIWPDMVACIHAAIDSLDADIQQCNNRLVQLAAEKKRGAPEMLDGQLEIGQ